MANVPPIVVELIDTFERNLEAYRSQQYNEAQVRREFIDPFFEALGWDVANKSGYAQAYKDVIHEDAIKIGGYTKAPDYCFRIGPVRKFFLEAKKPSIDVKGDPHPAYQLRRYAWSEKLPLSILTDFEEFAVYDCRIRPKHTDKADNARIMYLTYRDYAEKWDEIEGLFSKEAVLKGSFDKFAAETKGKRGTSTVDIEFLKEIEEWRRLLARTITLKNRKLSKHDINFAVQRTIDRILFLRMCEDRGIERYQQLLAVTNGRQIYPRLCHVFKQADAKYNSGLFHFRKERGRAEEPDELTLNLIVDDTPVSWIIRSLYYPKCPYEFSVLPAEILGNVYEQFLGKIIRITPGHRAIVEEKSEVKKAGGIYYTPNYIVDYIVKNTVGKLLGAFPNTLSEVEGSDYHSHCESAEGGRGNLKIKNRKPKFENLSRAKSRDQKSLTPKQIANLHILDPACGSGSFLLSTYTCLLNYHRDWYVDHNPAKYTKQIYQGKAGRWFLTIAEKKKILLNNIFGVDIDSQAVEVTKLSLLLKVLEGETAETIGQTYKMFHERALPDLGNNIKCGNSLIGPDFFDSLAPGPVPGVSKDQPRATSNEQRIITDELLRRINPFDYKSEFPQIFNSKKPGFDAVIGNPPYVRPHRIESDVKTALWKCYRPVFQAKSDLYACFMQRSLDLLNGGGYMSFIVSSTWLSLESFTALRQYILGKSKVRLLAFPPKKVFEKATVETVIPVFEKESQEKAREKNLIQIANFTQNEFKLEKQISQKLYQKTYLNVFDLSLDQFMLKLRKKLEEGNKIKLKKCIRFFYGLKTADDSKFLGADKSTPQHKKLLRRSDFARYETKWRGEYVWYVPEQMKKHRKTARPGDPQRFESPKIMVLDIAKRIVATLDEEGYYVKDALLFLKDAAGPDLKYVLAVLNSRLINYYYASIFRTLSVAKNAILILPIRTIDFNNPDDKAKHDKVVKLVERMLVLHKRLAAAKIPTDKTRIQRQINSTDSTIDNLVYQLYNLTPDEIAIIEGKDK